MHKNETNILLFDGVCNLCISIVNFTIKKDTKGKFKFAALQSESGQALLNKFGLSTKDFNSFIFISGDKYFIKSSAVLHVLKELGIVWILFYIFIVIPRPIRDFMYSIIAKTRYTIFGKQNTCFIPSPDIKRKFVD
jgi:predicted DCC family thiol-disulfide oxidoreductase YuxK